MYTFENVTEANIKAVEEYFGNSYIHATLLQRDVLIDMYMSDKKSEQWFIEQITDLSKRALAYYEAELQWPTTAITGTGVMFATVKHIGSSHRDLTERMNRLAARARNEISYDFYQQSLLPIMNENYEHRRPEVTTSWNEIKFYKLLPSQQAEKIESAHKEALEEEALNQLTIKRQAIMAKMTDEEFDIIMDRRFGAQR